MCEGLWPFAILHGARCKAMLNTFHLRTFLAVVDAGSYSAAAQLLHMSQPAVSQQIKALEDQLGEIKLFQRQGQRMILTHAGQELLPSARELVQLAERAEQSISALRGKVTGRVTLGCTPSSGERLLPRLLALFRAEYPAVAVELTVAPADALADALAEREVALLLLEEQQRRRGVESVPMGSEPLPLVAPVGHPLLAHKEQPPSALRGHPLVLPRPGSPLRRTIEDGLRRRGVAPADLRPALEADSAAAMLEAVRAGIGPAFMPKSCLPPRPSGYELAAVAMTPLRQEWHLLRARERGMPRAVMALYDFLIGPSARAALRKGGLAVPDPE